MGITRRHEGAKGLRFLALCLRASPAILRRAVNFTQTKCFIFRDLCPQTAELLPL